MPKVTIDGKTYDAPAGASVLETCQAFGLKVEHFCYHRYLKVDGNCRTCMVEIEGPRGRALVTACNTPVSEGLVVHTLSPKATTARKTALEFLLLDHPLDCPVCDKAGECSLQNNYMDYGLYDFRRGVPRHFKGGKALDIGEHILLDQERCILCRRCMRFLDAVTGTRELGITGRGHEAVLGIAPGKRLDNPYSGCVTDVCPVGALTLKEFRFKQRVWFLTKTESVCDGCARGCSITLEHNFNRIWRVMPRENPEENRVWICDEGRFAFPKHREGRLEGASAQGQALPLGEALPLLARNLAALTRGQVAAFASPFASMEDNWMLLRLFQERFDPADLAAPLFAPGGTSDDLLRLPEKAPNAAGVKALGIASDPSHVVKGIESGRVRALILMENDPLLWEGERYRSLLSRVPFLAVLATHRTPSTETASLVIPVRTCAEKDGTFVNAEGRLQRFRRAVDPQDPGISSSAQALALLAEKMGVAGLPREDGASCFNALAQSHPALAGMTFAALPPTGKKIEGWGTGAPAPFQGRRVDFNVVPTPGAKEGA